MTDNPQVVKYREFYRFLEHLPDAILVLNQEGKIVYANSLVMRLFEYSQKELVGQPVEILIPEKQRKILQKYKEGYLKNPKLMPMGIGPELIGKRKVGTVFPMEVSLAPLGNGEECDILCSIRDITRRRKLIETVRQSKERYRILFDQAPLGIFIFNEKFMITECNKHMCEILQTSFNNIIGLDTRKLNDKAFLNAIEKGLKGEISYTEFQYTTQFSCKELFLSLRVSPLLNENKYIIGGMGVLSDITNRKLAEETLKKLSRAVEQAADNIVISDKNGVIEYVNKAFTEVTDYTKQEVIGKTQRIFESGMHNNRCYNQARNTILSGNVFCGQFINEKKNGDLFYEEKTITPLKDSKGNITHFVSTGRDVTERKKLQEDLKHAQKMEAIGRLAGGVAHDFNNLLTVILSYSDMLLLHTESDDQLQVYLKEIKKAGERAAALTDQLLAFSRKKMIQSKVLDLNNVITDMEKMLKRVITENIDLITVLEPAIWCVKADPGQIEQVIVNLVVNAGDAMPKGGKLIIKTANVYPGEDDNHLIAGYETPQLNGIKKSHYVMLEVSDTGHGMDEETMSHIYEPFYTSKELGQGTGLGLATVHGIINQSGGLISVCSEINKGTTFKIYLPRIEGYPEHIEEIDSTDKKSLPGTETILVSEDEEVVRTIVVKVLEQKGYNVLEASDCDDALLICQQYSGPIHLIVTDVVMPKMSGPELVKLVRELRPDIKVLYMTGYTDNALVGHADIEEESHFLNKPLTPVSLSIKVREVLD